jgi:PAS domain S-box-containing protein
MKRSYGMAEVDIVSGVPWGTHICQFYETKEDLLDVLVPYFKAGLENNEHCVWITSEPLGVEEAKASLRKAVVALDSYTHKRQIEIIDATEWYVKSGKFHADGVLQALLQKEQLALEKGFKGLRVSGNSNWFEHRDWGELTVYEAAVDAAIAGRNIVAVCCYMLAKCTTSDVVDVVSNHDCTLIKQEGSWESIESTGRKVLERMLRKSEEQRRIITENIADVIWTVSLDSPERLTFITPSISRLLGYSVEEAMSKAMGEVFTTDSFQAAMEVFIEELDTKKMEHADITRSRVLELEMKHKDGSIIPVEIKFTFALGPDGKPVEILAIARDISERKRAEEEAERSNTRLIEALEDTMQALAMIVEMRDPYTAGHQRRVTQLACAIAREIGFPEEQITGLRLAGLIHDIGTVRVPAEILNKTSRLSEAEISLMKMHPLLGHEVLKTLKTPWPIAQIVYQHHERMDGSGYPSGISGEDIVPEARVLAVADVVEAMASHRPYRPAYGLEKALDEISQNRGTLYDPQAVDACLKLFREQYKFE